MLGLLLAGPLLTTLQLLAGLDSTGIAGSVSPCAAGRQKGLHVAHENGLSEMDFVLEDARIDSSLPTALPERGEAHEVDLVAETKVSQAFVECGDRVVTSLLSLRRDIAAAATSVVKNEGLIDF